MQRDDRPDGVRTEATAVNEGHPNPDALNTADAGDLEGGGQPETDGEKVAGSDLDRTGQEERPGTMENETPAEGGSAEEADPRDAEIARLRQQVQELNDRLLRAQADFENFRRRTRQEKEELVHFGSARLIVELLPALDNMERALRSAQETHDVESLAKGVEMVYRQLREALEKEGLQELDVVGQPFDPNLHEAVMQVESDTYPPNTVVEELRKGYRLKNKIIRPSMVKVSQ
jgi:molecular chaperone GrpE